MSASGVNGTGLANRIDHVHGKHALGMAEHRDQLGISGIVSKFRRVDQRPQLRERDSRNAGRGLGSRTETGRIRFETE